MQSGEKSKEKMQGEASRIPDGRGSGISEDGSRGFPQGGIITFPLEELDFLK